MPAGRSSLSWWPISASSSPVPGFAFILATVPYILPLLPLSLVPLGPGPARRRVSRRAVHLPNSGSSGLVGREDHARFGGDRLDGGVLGGEVGLNLLGFVEDGLGIEVGVLGALVGGGGLDVLADHDDAEEDQLKECLG